MHTRALKLDEELGRKEGMANQYGNLGIIHGERGDLDKAEVMFTRALQLDDDLGCKKGMADDYTNLGNIAEQRGDRAKACRRWRQARDLYAQVGIPHRVAQMDKWLLDAGCGEA